MSLFKWVMLALSAVLAMLSLRAIGAGELEPAIVYSVMAVLMIQWAQMTS